MPRIILVDSEKCTGCRLCEIACSVKKVGASDPSRARIRVIHREREGKYRPVLCQHCDDPLCSMGCPVNAIQREEAFERVVVDHEPCVGCMTCVGTCLVGAIRFDEDQRQVLRCDLCDGDPVCVRACPTGAVRYEDKEKVLTDKKDYMAKGLGRSLKVKS